MRKVIYTCITGNYDDLKAPQVLSEGFDYVCFTDDLTLKSDIWQIRPLPSVCEDIPQKKKQRFVKINPHIVLPEYDVSVWVDGSVLVKADLNPLIYDETVIIPEHPINKCTYAEMKSCLKAGKDTMENMRPQIDRYKKEGLPENYGMVQSNIIIRHHNREECKRLMDMWWSELSKGSHRDQLSFNYCLWKNPDISIRLLDKRIYDSEWFKWMSHKRKNVTRKKKLSTNNRRVKIYRLWM